MAHFFQLQRLDQESPPAAHWQLHMRPITAYHRPLVDNSFTLHWMWHITINKSSYISHNSHIVNYEQVIMSHFRCKIILFKQEQKSLLQFTTNHEEKLGKWRLSSVKFTLYKWKLPKKKGGKGLYSTTQTSLSDCLWRSKEKLWFFYCKMFIKDVTWI